MKIAMIGQKALIVAYSGIERHVTELSIRLVRQGHEVLGYTRPRYLSSKIKTHRGVRLVSIWTIPTKHLDAIVHALLCTLDAMRRRVDVIHYHGVGPSLVSWIPRVVAPNIRVVTTFHSIDRYHQKWGMVAQGILRLGEWSATHFAHVTIAVSKDLQKYCKEVYHRSTIYLPNGITPRPKRPLSEIRRRFGLESGEYFLMVTRLVPHKRVEDVIRAFSRLQTTKKLVIVGSGAYTDNYIQGLHALARSDDRVLFLGFQDGKVLDELYDHAHLYIHVSLFEGLPTAPLEAMAHGCPVILSDIPAHQELVKRGIQWVPARNVAELVSAMQFTLSHPKTLRTRGVMLRRQVLKAFAWDDLAKTIGEIYQALLRARQVDVPADASFLARHPS
ncbi:MAG: glycosyltransferase family 4 protein [Patescibacteria group bacterium]